MVNLGLRGRYPAIAGVSGAGQVTVLGGDRRCGVGDHVVLETEGLCTAAALDGADLRESRAVMLLPFSLGRVTLSAPSRSWERPVVLLGDLDGGRFRMLETLPAPAGRQVSIEVDADRATLIALVCEEERGRALARYVDLLVSTPNRSRGTETGRPRQEVKDGPPAELTRNAGPPAADPPGARTTRRLPGRGLPGAVAGGGAGVTENKPMGRYRPTCSLPRTSIASRRLGSA